MIHPEIMKILLVVFSLTILLLVGMTFFLYSYSTTFYELEYCKSDLAQHELADLYQQQFKQNNFTIPIYYLNTTPELLKQKGYS